MRMVRFSGARAAAVAALLSLAAAGAAAAQAGRVVGRVTDGTGRPVPNASVTLLPADTTAPRQLATADATGGFDFAAVAPGAYTLKASGDGYRDRVVPFALAPGSIETVIARLPEAPSRAMKRARDDAPAPRP